MLRVPLQNDQIEVVTLARHAAEKASGGPQIERVVARQLEAGLCGFRDRVDGVLFGGLDHSF
jgi:hypothetical protein